MNNTLANPILLADVLLSRGKANSLHDINRAADVIRAQAKALDLALCYLGKFEPGDSRAVSNEFVAMAAIATGDFNDDCIAIVDAAAAVIKAAS